VDKDRLEVSWTSPSDVASKIVRFELRLTHDDGSSWSTEFFQTTVTSAETYIFTGLTCNTKYKAMIRAVVAADDLIGPNGAVITALHNEIYGPWYSTEWQRLLACYVASSPGGYDGLTLTKGNFAHRHTLKLDWIEPTDDTNLDYFEIRYRVPALTSTWSYTTARPRATSKILYNDQQGTQCGNLYQVQIRSSGGHGDWAKGAWVEQTGRTKNCPLPTMAPTTSSAR
jgi:predicted phage tail protein